jgi:fumarate reductase subunit D
LLPSGDQDISAVALIFRLVLAVVLPLGLLAIEARLSERRKTFAFAITAVILIVIAAVWSTTDLVSLAFVLLGGSVLLGGAILLTRFLAARRPAPAGGGGS